MQDGDTIIFDPKSPPPGVSVHQTHLPSTAVYGLVEGENGSRLVVFIGDTLMWAKTGWVVIPRARVEWRRNDCC